MNFQPVDPQELERNQKEHYYKSNRFRAYCCGCIFSESSVIYICFCWSAISFYFSILAFMQKSPFYSYVQDVPLVAFGAINLLFGLVTLCSVGIFLIRISQIRWMLANGFMNYMENSRAVIIIAANALAVLVVTLVNFILFIKDKQEYDKWCIGLSAGYVKDTYDQTYTNISTTTATTISNVLNDRNDVYNCNRLYEDEVKWSLLCMIVMFVVYIHWILIVAARPSYNFYLGSQLPLPTEYGNIAPSKRGKNKINTFRSIKPSKGLLKELLVHKQYHEFGNVALEGQQREITLSANDNQSSIVVENSPAVKQAAEQTANNNVIVFDQDIYASREIKQPSSVFLQQQHQQSDPSVPPYDPRQSQTTMVNVSST